MSGENNGLGGLESGHDLSLSIPPTDNLSCEEKIRDDCQGCGLFAEKGMQ
jgi:hypothetical protein